MGYHVIIHPEDFPMKYAYVERIEQLVELEGINENSILFEGKRSNPPQQVGMFMDSGCPDDGIGLIFGLGPFLHVWPGREDWCWRKRAGMRRF